MVKLGDWVKDEITGCEGVVMSHHIYLYGCERFSVQPPMDKDGNVPDLLTFDKPQLKVITEQYIKVEAPATSLAQRPSGGPKRNMPLSRET